MLSEIRKAMKNLYKANLLKKLELICCWKNIKIGIYQDNFRFEYINKCNICKGKTEGKHNKFCHTCSYKKGICEMCGKKVVDVSMYRQSDV